MTAAKPKHPRNRVRARARRHLLVGLALLLAGAPGYANEANDDFWALCRPLADPNPPFASEHIGNEVRVSADALDSAENASGLLFSGAVKLQQRDNWLTADKVEVFETPRRIVAEGNIEAKQPAMLVRSDTAEFIEADDYARFSNVRYQFNPRHAYGSADAIELRGEIATLDRSSFSTCDPGDPDWILKADNIVLDRDRGVGTAREAALYFKGVPLLYLPIASFPIDDRRRSGLLYPSIGSSSGSGLIVNIPVYWNIAPQLDATLTPRYLNNRGIMLDSEFRYLGRNYRGELDASHLADRKVDEARQRFEFNHSSSITRHWSLDLSGTRVSDHDYYLDFGDSLNDRSLTHLERRADLSYRSRFIEGLIRGQAFQTIDPGIALAARPYRRLPQIVLNINDPFGSDRFGFSLESELTRFVHDDNLEGNRLELAPRASLRWQRPGYYVQPALTWHYTRYDLDAFGAEPARDLTRAMPLASVDSGLFFERPTAAGGLQTLEPRLFYTYIPYRDQDTFPVFDTNETAFSFATLFRDNRFSGSDRIGDANQFTLGLTTRTLRPENGAEHWRASLGQVYYLHDREVTLPGGAPAQDSRSDYAAELSYTGSQGLSGRASVLVDAEALETRVSSVMLNYRIDRERLVNLEYRLRRDEIEQTNLSFVWPLRQNWRLFGRWLYSLEDTRHLELMGGLEYESCCWAARALNRRFILNDQEDYNDAFYFELILKGLGSLGKAGSLLQQLISGYQNELD
ncbi:MAG: LPS-assembly protein LptD [Thiotrichales bacterium]